MRCEHFPFYLTWVVTLMPSGAHVFALRGLRTTGDGRVQDGESTVARQLVKTCRHKNQGVTWDAGSSHKEEEQRGKVKTFSLTHWTASRDHSFHDGRAPGSGGGHSLACSHRSGGTCAPRSEQTKINRRHHIICWLMLRLWRFDQMCAVNWEFILTSPPRV